MKSLREHRSAAAGQVLAFIAGEAAREVEADRASVAAAMWQVLRLLALNSGSLRTQSKLVRTTKDQDTPGNLPITCQSCVHDDLPLKVHALPAEKGITSGVRQAKVSHLNARYWSLQSHALRIAKFGVASAGPSSSRPH